MKISEQVSQFTYLGCSISCQFSNDVEFKLAKFFQLISTIKGTIFKKVSNGNYSENIQHTSFTYIFVWVRKLDSNSLTKPKNWSGRNEVTETSGRLHTLWPQNKWLHTPRTADYSHTGQDRWIQTELAFTRAKNVTKPNPFKSYRYRPQGRRTVGRPKKRWTEQL